MDILNILMQNTIFTHSEKIVSNYIIENKESIINMSIQDLAKSTYTSNPTILRVCRKCHCNGFKDFKIQLAKEIEQLTFEISHIDANIPFKKNDTCHDIAKYMSNLFQDSIRRTFKLIDEKAIKKAVQIISKSQFIYMYGYADSLIPARSFSNKLLKINKHTIIAFDGQQETFHTYNISNQDCAIMISYRGTNKLIPYCQYLIKKNVPIICITSNIHSAIAKYANIVIQIAKNEDEKSKIASFSSLIEIKYIFSVLFSCVFALNYEKNYIYKNLNIKELYDLNLL